MTAKERKRRRWRQYYLQNKERLLEAARKWRRDNPEKIREQQKRKKEKRKEKLILQGKNPRDRKEWEKGAKRHPEGSHSRLSEFLRRHDVSLTSFGKMCGFLRPCQYVGDILRGHRRLPRDKFKGPLPTFNQALSIKHAALMLGEQIEIGEWWPHLLDLDPRKRCKPRSTFPTSNPRKQGKPSLEEALAMQGQPPSFGEEDFERLEEALGQIGERERLVLQQRNEGKTLEEVSLQIGRTKERVRQIQNLALEKMRRILVA